MTAVYPIAEQRPLVDVEFPPMVGRYLQRLDGEES